jgi:hypothetical protein
MTTENNLKNEATEAPLPISECPANKKTVDSSFDEVVICDECGDSLWDAVLAQDEKANAIQHVCKIPMR